MNDATNDGRRDDGQRTEDATPERPPERPPTGPQPPVEPATGPQVRRDVLRARAWALAQEPQEGLTGAGGLDVVEFLLADERYGVPSTSVREVYPLRDLTPLPCTPPFVLGMINVRGQILAVIDVRRFFDLPAKGLTDLNKVIILQAGDTQVGILADRIVGVRSLTPDDLQPPFPTLTGVRADYLRGVTGDRLAVLDADRILADERIVVHEEVEGEG